MEELNINHFPVVQYLKQIGKFKKFHNWVPHELTKNFKTNRHFEVSSFLIQHNNEPFLDQTVICNKKQTVYDNQRWPAQLLDWEDAPKHFSEPNLHQKVTVTLCWSAAYPLLVVYHSLLNPSKTITSEMYAQQMDEMHWKLQCLQPAPVNRRPNSPQQCPTTQWTTNTSKVEH